MQSVTITKHGAPEVLSVRRKPDPIPATGEVRIRTRFAGLNFAEVMARQGLYPDAPPPPCVVGYEVSGEIDAVGPGVDEALIGERVAAMTRFGGHADTVCVPEAFSFSIPDEMSFEEAAALPVNYITAYHILFEIRRVRPGETILLHMAAGGVGTAVLQLASMVEDLTVIGTASARKHDYIREHGADHAIDYRTESYVERVNAITKGRGVDLVIDALGGSDWRSGYRLLRPTGQLVAFGFANMNRGGKRRIATVLNQIMKVPLFSPLSLMDENRSVAGVNLGHLWEEQEMMVNHANALVRAYQDKHIKPQVDRVFPFREAAEAHRYLETGQNRGKVLLKPS
jgi:NADPH:quinone reductase-like Zn-dependent oxidoreductase